MQIQKIIGAFVMIIGAFVVGYYTHFLVPVGIFNILLGDKIYNHKKQ